jgi:hypothetical protein
VSSTEAVLMMRLNICSKTFFNFRKRVVIFKEALAGTIYYAVSRPKLS